MPLFRASVFSEEQLLSDAEITERPRHWLEHIKAADAVDGSVADFARAERLRPKVLNWWKMILARRGPLPGKQISVDIVQVMG